MAWSPGPTSDVHQAEDRLLGAREDRARRRARSSRRAPAISARRSGWPGRLGVAEAEAVPQRPRLVVGEGEQLGHRVALDVRGAEQVLDGELPAGEVALEGELGDAHRTHRCGTMPAHGSHRSSIVGVADLARRPPRPGWNGRRPGCASSGCSSATPGATRPGGRRAARRRATSPSTRAWPRPGPAGEEPGGDLRVPARASATSSRRRSASGADDARAADPRRRLHGPCRGDGRARAGPAGRPASRSPGSTPTATSTRPTRRRRATSGGCRSRCSAAAATRTSWPPATGRRSWSRTPRCSAARSSTRPSPGCWRRRGSPTSGRACSARAPARPRSPAGRASVAARVDGLYIAFDLDCLDAIGRLGADDARARRDRARDRARSRPGSSRRRSRSSGSAPPRSRSRTATARRRSTRSRSSPRPRSRGSDAPRADQRVPCSDLRPRGLRRAPGTAISSERPAGREAQGDPDRPGVGDDDRRSTRVDDLGPGGDDAFAQRVGRLAAGPVDLRVPGRQLRRESRVRARRPRRTSGPRHSPTSASSQRSSISRTRRRCSAARAAAVSWPPARARDDPDARPAGSRASRAPDPRPTGGPRRQGRIAPAAVALAGPGRRARDGPGRSSSRRTGDRPPSRTSPSRRGSPRRRRSRPIASAAPDASPRRRSSSRIGARPEMLEDDPVAGLGRAMTGDQPRAERAARARPRRAPPTR